MDMEDGDVQLVVLPCLLRFLLLCILLVGRMIASLLLYELLLLVFLAL